MSRASVEEAAPVSLRGQRVDGGAQLWARCRESILSVFRCRHRLNAASGRCLHWGGVGGLSGPPAGLEWLRGWGGERASVSWAQPEAGTVPSWAGGQPHPSCPLLGRRDSCSESWFNLGQVKGTASVWGNQQKLLRRVRAVEFSSCTSRGVLKSQSSCVKLTGGDVRI